MKLDLPTWLRSRIWRALWLAVPVFLFVLVIRMAGWLEPSGLLAHDAMLRWQAPSNKQERVLVVGFSESDFKSIPNYPFNDDVLAQILEALNRGKPRAVYLGVLRDVPVEPGHARLLAAYRAMPMLYGVDSSGPEGPGPVPPPPVLRDTGRFGGLKSFGEHDDINRTVYLGYELDQRWRPSALLLMVNEYLKSEQRSIELLQNGSFQVGRTRYPLMSEKFGEYQSFGNSEASYQLGMAMLPPASRERIAVVSFADVLSGKVPPERFDGKLVLIGSTLLTLQREQHTAMQPPSVGRGIAYIEMTAANADDLIALAEGGRPAFRAFPEWLEYALLFALAWVACWRFMSYRSLWTWCWRGSLFAVSLVLLAWLLFHFSWWFPVVPSLATLLLASVAVVNNLIRAEAAQRQVIASMNAVLNQLPDPIYLLDQGARFRVANEAFCRIAVMSPEELFERSESDIFGPLTIPNDKNAEQLGQRTLTNALGQQLSLRLNEMAVDDEHGRPLRIGMIKAIVSAQQTQTEHADEFSKRFAQACYWADRNEVPLALAIVELNELDLLEQVHGAALLPEIMDSIADRLGHAYPDHGGMVRAGFQIKFLLARSGCEDCAALRGLIAQTFSWPLAWPKRDLEIDLKVGCAMYGTDAKDLAALERVALDRMSELPIDMTQRNLAAL